jgi:hypothetical protein
LERLKAILAGVATMVMATTVACGSSLSSYFPTNGDTTVSVPKVGSAPAYVGVELLVAEEGDRVRLEALDVVGLHGEATVAGLVALLRDERNWIGAGTEADITSDGLDLSAYVPLAGVEFEKSDGPAALAVEVFGDAPILGFESVRLRFTVNGGPEQVEAFAFRAIVCTNADFDEAVRMCEQAHRSAKPSS